MIRLGGSVDDIQKVTNSVGVAIEIGFSGVNNDRESVVYAKGCTIKGSPGAEN